MDLVPGDVVLVEVRFHQAPGAKVRPTVVVLDSGDEDFVGAPITTRVRSTRIRLEPGRLASRWPQCAVDCQSAQARGLGEGEHPPDSWQIVRRRPRTPSRGALPGVLPPYGIACALPGLLLTSPRPTRHTKLKETVGALIRSEEH